MKTLSFSLFVLFSLCSTINAGCVAWSSDSTTPKSLSNANLVQRLELLMVTPGDYSTNFNALPERYRIAIKLGQKGRFIKSSYNSLNAKSDKKHLIDFFKNGKLSTRKNNKDNTQLKEYAYTLSHISGKSFNFYILPHAKFYQLKLDQRARFKTATSRTRPQSTSRKKSTELKPKRKHKAKSKPRSKSKRKHKSKSKSKPRPTTARPRPAPREIPQRKPTITFFGSCRVRLPFFALGKKVNINNGKVPFSCYTAAEAVQMYKIATGQLALPPENMRDLLWMNAQQRIFEITDYSATEAFIVESCSLKEFILDDYYLSNTQVLKVFQKPLVVAGKKTYPLIPYYNHLIAESEVAAGLIDPYKPRPASTLNVPQFFRGLPRNFLSQEDAYILENLEVNTLTEQEFIQHMEDFSNLVNGKPVIFISHVNARGGDGNSLYARELTDRYIQKGAQKLGQHFFRPGDLFIKHAQEEVLVSRDDINHYAENFMPKVGEAILSIVRKIL